MNKTHKLTILQQQYAEEHIGIVYAFLRHKNLPVDEYYDIVIFGYLSAVQDFDENPELSRYSFTTIAWRRMNSCLCDHYTYENRQKRHAVTVSIHSGTEYGLTLDEILPERRKGLQEQTDDRMLLLEILSCLTETEKQMVLLKADGLTFREIGEQFSLSAKGIFSRFRRMRDRLAMTIGTNTCYITNMEE